MESKTRELINELEYMLKVSDVPHHRIRLSQYIERLECMEKDLEDVKFRVHQIEKYRPTYGLAVEEVTNNV